MEGTAYATDDEGTVSASTLCAGALRSSFGLALERLKANDIDPAGLGLAIGYEFGPMTVTRLGMQGDRGAQSAAVSSLLKVSNAAAQARKLHWPGRIRCRN
jgi:hypothetical protein